MTFWDRDATQQRISADQTHGHIIQASAPAWIVKLTQDQESVVVSVYLNRDLVWTKRSHLGC